MDSYQSRNEIFRSRASLQKHSSMRHLSGSESAYTAVYTQSAVVCRSTRSSWRLLATRCRVQSAHAGYRQNTHPPRSDRSAVHRQARGHKPFAAPAPAPRNSKGTIFGVGTFRCLPVISGLKRVGNNDVRGRGRRPVHLTTITLSKTMSRN